MELKKINEYTWEIPKAGEMRVPGIIFSSEELIGEVKTGGCLEQVENVAKLPGILKASYAMADAHRGYGFPIGGVAAFDLEKGIVSPGGVGYDINCSVRLLKTNLKRRDLDGKEREILHSLFRTIPTGIGKKSLLNISQKELDEILTFGARWMIKKGYGSSDDLDKIEDNGCLSPADPRDVSKRAKLRGIGQMGSLGAGNHFVDVLEVTEIFEEKVAKIFGLEKGQVVILIHCGSRGLGHQVASDYIKEMDGVYGHPKYDRELVHAPIQSDLGKKYLSAMSCAANFAFANKQLLTHFIRKNLQHYFKDFKADVVYDICHNIAKIEKHEIDGIEREVLILRKGATRSLGPNRKEIPKDYAGVGAPILIPGSMGTPSYVLCGTKMAEEISLASTAHGAGRVKSRSQAKRELTFEEAKKRMQDKEIFVESGSKNGIIEEFPDSYKDIEGVVNTSHNLGIGKKVAKLSPFLVLIG